MLKICGLRFTAYGGIHSLWLAACSLQLIFTSFPLLSQSTKYTLLKSIPVNASILSSDKLGNCYVVNEKNELLKFNPAGEPLFTHTNKSLGRISFVGTTNPLKILVYYPDYSTIITLDNTLSQTGRINLLESGVNNVSAACVSLDNNFWIYDEVLFRLRKFDAQFNILNESEDLNVLLGEPVRANFLLEKDNYLYLNDSSIGIFVFDTYGTYSKIIPLKGVNNFQKVNDNLVYFMNGKLFSYNLLTFATEEIPLPATNAIGAVVEKDRLFLLKKEQLDVFSH